MSGYYKYEKMRDKQMNMIYDFLKETGMTDIFHRRYEIIIRLGRLKTTDYMHIAGGYEGHLIYTLSYEDYITGDGIEGSKHHTNEHIFDLNTDTLTFLVSEINDIRKERGYETVPKAKEKDVSDDQPKNITDMA